MRMPPNGDTALFNGLEERFISEEQPGQEARRKDGSGRFNADDDQSKDQGKIRVLLHPPDETV